jgi:hypothetical protein
LGDDLATLQVPESMISLDKEETLEFNKQVGNLETGTEIGTLLPKDQNQYWYIVFEYINDGYIKDEDASDIVPHVILQGYKDSDEQQNIEREKLADSRNYLNQVTKGIFMKILEGVHLFKWVQLHEGNFRIELEDPVSDKQVTKHTPTPSESNKDVLLLIDGYNLINKSFYATARNAKEPPEDGLRKTSEGKYTNAVYEFLQRVFQIEN